MAVKFGGFSIREYVSNMRTVDVKKCWPFAAVDSDDGDDDEDADQVEKKKMKEVVESLLPPITVTKFRWWSDELELLKSKSKEPDNDCATAVQDQQQELEEDGEAGNKKKPGGESSENPEPEKPEMVCPVCQGFTAATVNAVNAHMDSCLAQAAASKKEEKLMFSKSKKVVKKSKAPKKRSIADIFAVAPPIETTIVVEADEDDPVEKNDKTSSRVRNLKKKWKKKEKNNKKITIKKRVFEENSTGTMPITVNKWKKKNKKDKEKLTMIEKRKSDWSISNKEIGHQLKLHTSVDLNRIPNGVQCNTTLLKENLSSSTVFLSRKKSSPKSLSTQKDKRHAQTSESDAKKHKPVVPIRHIFKNHKKAKMNPSTRSLQDCSKANNITVTRQSGRHVTFSGIDDIIGPRTKTFSNVLEKSFRNLSLDSFDYASSENDQSSESSKEVIPIEVSGSDDGVCTSTGNETEFRPVTGKKLLPANMFNHVDIPNFPSPHIPRQKNFAKKSVSADQVAIHGSLNLCGKDYPCGSSKPAFSGIPRGFVAPGSKRPNYCVNFKVDPKFSGSGNLCNHHIDSSRGRAAMSSVKSKQPVLAPSPSYLPSNENTHRVMSRISQSAAENSRVQNLQLPAFHRSPPADHMIGRCHLYAERKQRIIANRDKYCTSQDDFFGLPLNSQGELIQIGSSTSNGFINQPNEMQNVVRERPVHHLNLFPLQSNENEKRNVQYLPARFGTMEWEGARRADSHHWVNNSEMGRNHSFNPLDSNLNLMNVHHDGSRLHGLSENQTGNATQLQTMRLMGKDVAVGTSSKEMQRSEEEKSWNGKEIFTEFLPSSSSTSSKRKFSEDLTLQKDSVFHPFEIQNETPYPNRSSSNYFNENPSLRLQLPYAPSPSTSTAMLGVETGFPDYPFMCGAEMLRAGPRYLPCIFDPYEQKDLPLAMKPTIPFPFLHPDTGEHVQLMSCLRSHDNGMDRRNHLSRPLPEVFYTPYGQYFPPHLQMRSSLMDPTSMFHPQAIPVLPGVNPNCGGHSRIKIRERLKSNNLGVKVNSNIPSKRLLLPQKRPASKPVIDSRKSTKIPNLGTRDSSAGESCSNESHGADSSMFSMVRAGPTKLSAGAKHILKPSSQCLDLDNSRLTHSTIPFTELSTGCVSMAESQKKSTHIYRF